MAALLNLAAALSPTHYRTKSELAYLLEVTPREVEHLVESARKNSELPIMSCGLGYRLALSSEEYESNVALRKRRAIHQLLTVRGEKRLLRRWRESEIEQQSLWAA